MKLIFIGSSIAIVYTIRYGVPHIRPTQGHRGVCGAWRTPAHGACGAACTWREHVQAPAAISKQYSPACRYGVPHKDTYNDEDDVFPSRYLIIPAALLGLAVNQVTLLLTLILTPTLTLTQP